MGLARGTTCLALLLAAYASASEAEGAQAEPAPPSIFDTHNAPGFDDPRPALRAYLARSRPRPRGAQHFCIVGYAFGDRQWRSAQVRWREGGRLITWHGNDPAYPADLLTWGSPDLDLTRDVVASGAEIGGSTYLVTRAWVDRVLADCAARGTRYTIMVPATSRRRR